MSGISSIARVPDHLDVFWVGADGRVYSSWWHAGLPWSGAFSIGGFFPPGAAITAVSRMPNHLDLFVVGNDGRVYTSWWHEGQPWSGANDNWQPIGGFFPPGASVHAIARVSNHLDVFVIGNDGRVYTSWWHEGHPWSGANDNWTSIGGFFPTTASVSALARRPDHLDVFITGNDGRVYTSWWHEGHPWSGVNDNWTSIGGFFPPGNHVASVARQSDHLDLFITGNDGRVYTSWWHEGHPWSGANDNWASLGGFFPTRAPLAAVARRPDHLDLFITGNDGRVYTSWWHEGHSWSGVNDNWASLGGFFPPGEKLAAVARQSDHLDLFLRGNDGLIYSSWWHEGQGWSGVNDNWFTINVGPGARLDLHALRVEDAQEDGILSDGDEPYVVTLGYRSRFRTPGSTQVFWGGDLHELGDLDAGDQVGIPPSMGHVDFPGVRVVTRDDLVRFEFPDVFGALVLVLESDATPFGLVRDLVERIRSALQTEIARLIEGGQLISDLTAPPDQITAEVRENLRQAIGNVIRALDVSVGEAISLWLQSAGDPDDFIGFHAFVYAGVDDSLATLLPPMASDTMNVGPFRPGPVDFVVAGDGARYRLTGAASG